MRRGPNSLSILSVKQRVPLIGMLLPRTISAAYRSMKRAVSDCESLLNLTQQLATLSQQPTSSTLAKILTVTGAQEFICRKFQ